MPDQSRSGSKQACQAFIHPPEKAEDIQKIKERFAQFYAAEVMRRLDGSGLTRAQKEQILTELIEHHSS